MVEATPNDFALSLSDRSHRTAGGKGLLVLLLQFSSCFIPGSTSQPVGQLTNSKPFG
jgi:hypothetical protein